MVSGYKGNKYKGFNEFKDAVEWLAAAGNDTFHFRLGIMDGPKTNTNEHSGKPECYVATNGRGTAVIFDNYRYGCPPHPRYVL